MPEIELIERPATACSKAQRLAYLILERPDLDRARDFFEDFGLVVAERADGTLRLRGRLPRPIAVEVRKGAGARLLGFALDVGDAAALDRLAALPGASAIEANDAIVGGRRVTLTDPNGFTVHAVAGLADLPALPVRPPLAINAEGDAPRLNSGQRPPQGPSEVLRIGHLVINVVEFRRSLDWYMSVFGLIPTDVLHLDDGSPAVTFLRCDKGDDPAEHHTLVLAAHVETGFGHCAMEVMDLDAIATGGDHLRARGFGHAWGIGRHLLGSQLFDYWRDPWGAKFEHYADSDLFDAAHPTGYHPLDTAGLYQWGPDLPGDFEDTRMTLPRILRVLRTARDPHSELTFARIRGLKRAMAAPARPWMRK